MNKILAKLKAAQAAARALHDKAVSEDRELNATEQAEFEKQMTAAASFKKQVEQAGILDAADADFDKLESAAGKIIPAASRQNNIERAGGPEAAREFSSLGEFVFSVLKRPNDQRLSALWHDGTPNAEMRMDTGSSGGFAVPKQFRPELMQEEFPDAVIRPRATVIPPGSPPDAEVSMPALDQSTTNQYGGVTVGWIGEGGTKPSTDAALREITLIPKEVAGIMTVTDKLLRNWDAASSVLNTLLGAARIQAEENAFMVGNGIGKPLGYLSVNNGSLIGVNRTTANLVKFADIANMFANFRLKPGSIFVYNPGILPQLINLQDGAGRVIWLGGDASKGIPNTLLGLPAIPSENAPVLGSKGDLSLIDPKSYLIKDGSGPFLAASEHVNFATNKTAVKITWNVDGQPWLKLPIKGNDGRLYTPFVALDVPAG